MNKLLQISVLMLTVAGMSPSWGDQNNPELNQLFVLLQESEDPVEAAALTQKVWENWYQTNDPDVERLLQLGELSIRRGMLDEAVQFFSEIIEIQPGFSEAWNRRATVYYMMGEYDLSTSDIAATLNLEPRHFGALSGQGMIYAIQNNRDQALQYYEKALEYNPHLSNVKENVEIIKEQIAKEII